MPLQLTTLKHAIMKIDSFQTDIRELCEEEDIDPQVMEVLNEIADVAGNMETALIKIIAEDDESEDNFMKEEVRMDDLDPYPDQIKDIEDILL